MLRRLVLPEKPKRSNIRLRYPIIRKMSASIMSNLVHNEQTKLFASFLNNLGVAAFAAGLVIPLVSLGFAERSWVFVWPPVAMGTGIGIYLMMQAQKYLERLKE